MILGRLISKGAITIKPSHTITISNWPVPVDKKSLQRIIGLANYFRKFIPNYSTVIAPLSELTGSVPYEWTPARQQALEELQRLLTSSPVLTLPNSTDPLRIFSDASGVASGALLEQQHNGKWLPVAFTSKMFSSPERKYPTHD